MNAIQLLKHKFHKLTIDEAAWLGKLYDCDDEVMLVSRATPKRPERLSLTELDKLPWETISFARDIKVSFWGGPPAHESYHFGTVLTFMIDRILRAQAGGIGFGWLLMFDGNSAKSLGRQLGDYLPDILTQKRLFQEPPFDGNIYYPEYDNPVVDTVQVGSTTIPIYEDGSQDMGVGAADQVRIRVRA